MNSVKVDVVVDQGRPHFVVHKNGQKFSVYVDLQPRQDVGLKSDLLKRALGVRSGEEFRVLDVTAGLLRDSVHLAQLGGQVLALEKHPDIFRVASAALQASPLADRIQLLHTDAVTYLNAEAETDYIYVDPMYPEKKKDALSGKESQLLQILVGEPSPGEVEKLLEICLHQKVKRVVVKRPVWAPVLLEKNLSHSVKGKSTRYDVYLRL